MKKTKKLISIVLSVLIVAMSLSCVAFAQDKTNYVVLGDSIAYGSGLANPVDACYGKIIADTCGFDYVNHSVPGATTQNLIDKLAVEEVIEDVAAADVISISIGGNDFLMNNIIGLMFEAIVKGDYSTFDEIGERFYGNLSKIIAIIKEANPDAVILMQSLYNPQEGYLREPYQQGADRINAAIARYSDENPGAIVIVDVGSALGDDPANYAGDAVHPSAKGNEIIAAEVLAALVQEGLTDKTELNPTVAAIDFDISPMFAMIFSFYGTFFHILSVVFGPLFAICK